jgi:integrase
LSNVPAARSRPVELGVIDRNPAHGVRRPKDNVNRRRLSEQDYRLLGKILGAAIEGGRYATAAEMIRLIALTGCRRSEIIKLRWEEIDNEGSCLRLSDSKEGASVRPVGLPALEHLESRRTEDAKGYVFPGWVEDAPFGAFPSHWDEIFGETALADITPRSCATASPASPTTSASPKRPSPPWSAIRGAR